MANNKNFKQMSSKKLNALLNTVSEEEKAEINAILAERATMAPGGQQPAAPAAAPTEEQPAAPAQEVNLDELKEACKVNMHHKCQVVPFNTAEWKDGVIVGMNADKKTQKVTYIIRLDDNRTVAKVYNSPLLKISEEVAEVTRKTRTASGEKAEAWDEATRLEEIAKVTPNVGKQVTITVSELDTLEGRIVGVLSDKRVNKLFYTIEVEDVDGKVKRINKVVTSEAIKIAEDFDEEGAKLNEAYASRRTNAATRKAMTPEEKIEAIKADIAKITEKRDALNAKLEALNAELQEAQTAQAPAPAAEAEESLD